MFNSFNNLSETEEQKRRRINDTQMQTPYTPGHPPMTPRQMVERVWDKSAAEQEAKMSAYKPMENMSTRDAATYVWNRSAKEQEKKETLKKNI